ncbi:MAG: D-glycerate dehydrogenase [Gemmatimonadaceae bacterium]|nr:D-glycerate dehydrogenase [Gemmatimonadaceae bacterium]
MTATAEAVAQSHASVVVTSRLPDSVERTLARDYHARLFDRDDPMSAEALREALAGHEVVLCTLTDRLDRAMLTAGAGRVRLLANFGAGTNHIDLGAARDLGIRVTTPPGALPEDTADLTMLLILAAARRAREGDAEVRERRWRGWRPTHLLGTRVSGATLGIVGFGRIGQAVARRAAAGFGMTVRYHGRRRASAEAEAASGATFEPELEQLLHECDIVSLHCPATPETHHLIGAPALRCMRRDAFLINTARGDVVHEDALIAALQDGTIAGAGLDVFEREPEIPEALRTLPNVFALPHLGSATRASRVAMGECAVRNIAAYLRGEPLPDLVP